MKPKVELGKEYPLRKSGIGVVFMIADGRAIGAKCLNGNWSESTWLENGHHFFRTDSDLDLILPRIVMVPVEVPEWAKFVEHFRHASKNHEVVFYNTRVSDSIRIDDWIASLGGEK